MPPGALTPCVLMFLSGAAALVYETVWMRMLIRVFGVTLHATSAVAAAFLGGMAVGSWAAARARSGPRPLRRYAAVELAAAASAVAVTFLLKPLPAWVAGWGGGAAGAWNEPTWADAVTRLAAGGAVLLVPAALLGASTPFLLRGFADGRTESGPWMAWLYGANTLGAVFGTAFAGAFALGALGETGTAALGVALSTAAGLAALKADRARPEAPPAPPGRAAPAPLALAAAAGLVGLALQAAWLRLFVMLVGNSVYAFSATLGLQLLGTGLGGLWSARRLRAGAPSSADLGTAFVLLGTAGVFGLEVFRLAGLAASEARFLYSPLAEPWAMLPALLGAALAALPASFALGALFPMTARAAEGAGGDAGGALGLTAAANTAGCVAGTLGAGYLLVPVLGAEGTLLAAAALAAAVGLAARPPRWAAAPLLLAVALGWHARNASVEVLANRLDRAEPRAKVAFHRHDREADLTGFATESSGSGLLLNGIAVSGTGPVGRALVHVPALLREARRSALVICFGVGNTFHDAVGEFESVDVVELVGGEYRVAGEFHPGNPERLRRPGVRVFVDDGRHHLLARAETKDLVMVDASPPVYSAGAVNLYSVEFLRLARARLNPGGIFALWFPTPCFRRDFGMVARGFAEVFPHTAVWTRPELPGALIMGSEAPLALDEAAFKRLAERRTAERWPELTPELLKSGWAMGDAALRRFASEYPAVTDDRPRTEYPLGLFLAGERVWRDAGFLWE